MIFQYNRKYISIALLLLLIEIGIAVYLTSGFIRHTFGDYLVVILVYCVIRGFTSFKVKVATILSLSIAFTVEFLQLIQLLELLQLQQNTLARVVLGTQFSISDLVAYSLGIVSVIIIEYKPRKHCKHL